jgi:hypothetical protein
MGMRTDGKLETLRKMRAAMAAEDGVPDEFGLSEAPLPESPVMEMDPLYITGRVPPDSKLTPEQMDVVTKFAAERAKPMEAPSEFSDGPSRLSDEERARRELAQARRKSSSDEGWAMIQQGGREIGDAISGNKSDTWLYDTLSKQAKTPVTQMEADQEKRAKLSSEKSKRSAAVRQFVLEQQAKKDEGAAKLLEENRRRGEDRSYKLGDEAEEREWKERQAHLNRASAERAASNSAGTKAAEKESQLEVPGYTRAPGAPGIKPEEAGGLRDLVAAEQEMGTAMDSMSGAKKATGREFLPGPDKDTQSGSQASMLLALKGLAKTGALDEQTERVARGLIPGPSDGPEAAEAKLKQLRSLVESKMGGYAKSRGYEKQDRSEPQGGGGLPPEKKARLEELRRKKAAGELR